MGKSTQDWRDFMKSGPSTQDIRDFYFRSKSRDVPIPLDELTIYEMMMSGALPSDFYAKGGLAGIKKPLIPEAIPLVKQFRNDDPTTYLTDEEQMKGMLITTLEGQPRAVDQEVLAEVDEQQNIS